MTSPLKDLRREWGRDWVSGPTENVQRELEFQNNVNDELRRSHSPFQEQHDHGGPISTSLRRTDQLRSLVGPSSSPFPQSLPHEAPFRVSEEESMRTGHPPISSTQVRLKTSGFFTTQYSYYTVILQEKGSCLSSVCPANP